MSKERPGTCPRLYKPATDCLHSERNCLLRHPFCSEHTNTWATASLPPSHGTPSQARHSHRHSAHGYASLLSRPIYHPLQHQRGSDRGTAMGDPSFRRVSSLDDEVNSLRRYPPSRREESPDVRSTDSGRVRSPQRRDMVQRGRVQGPSSGSSKNEVQHWRSKSDKPRETGGLKLQRRQTDTCLSYYQQGSTGSQAGQTTAGLARSDIGDSQTSWEGGEGQHDRDSVSFRKTRQVHECARYTVHVRIWIHVDT